MLSLRCLERSGSILFLVDTERSSNYVQYKDEGWIKFNYDTVAATTAPAVELAKGLPLCRVDEFIVANGQGIPNFGRAKFQTVDEFGNKCKMEGPVTEAREPPSSASKCHDAFIFEEFAELQAVYDDSVIDCVSFMVIMEFYLCIEKEDCTITTRDVRAKWRWHQRNRIKTS